MVTWATHPCLGIVVRPNPVNHPSANTLAGIAYVVLSVACFAVLDTVTKNVSASMSLMLALWFRYLIQALFSTVFFLPKRGMALFKTDHPRFQVARGVLLFVSSMCAFYGLKYLPVGEFTAIASVTPLVVTLMAAMSLGEKVRKLRWALVLGAFAGTLVIVRPGSQHFDWVLIFPLVAYFDQLKFSAAHAQNDQHGRSRHHERAHGLGGHAVGRTYFAFRLGTANRLALVVATAHHGHLCHSRPLPAHHGVF